MRRFLWVPFALALAAFVLPFATVSCDGMQVEPSGADFVLRTPPEATGPDRERLDLGGLVVAYGGGLATAAFLGFAFALLAAVRRWDGGWVVLGAAAALASLLLLQTRSAGEAEEVTDVEVREGAYVAFGAGAAGLALGAATWLRDGRPALRPAWPLVGALLIVFGYLWPFEGAAGVETAYVDTLDLREPWKAAFWAVPVAVGLALLARRRRADRRLAGFAVGALVVAGLEVAGDVWDRPGPAPLALLAGIVTLVGWAIAGQWSERRPPARAWLLAGVAVALAAWVARP
ncbi:MAG TPA: hypothetical protein VF236_09980 [Gaiellaceae bacterium]